MPSYDHLVTIVETCEIKEVKASLLSNEIMRRPNLEEDTSPGLVAKGRGRS